MEIHMCKAPFMCHLSPQLTLYLGKRDYVDHVDTVDAVGEQLSTFMTDKKYIY